MKIKEIGKRVSLVLGAYLISFFIYVLMESSRWFCPNRVLIGTTVCCIDYLWKAIVWSLFYFILVSTLYFVERKYLNSWRSLILMLTIPSLLSIYTHLSIINMSKNANGIGNYIYSSYEVLFVVLINFIFLFGFFFWFKKERLDN